MRVLQWLAHEPSGHRCRESLRNSLWVAARGAFASGQQGRLWALQFAGPQAKPQAVARSQGSHAGSADAELLGFSRNYREQVAPDILHGGGPGPQSGDNLRRSNSIIILHFCTRNAWDQESTTLRRRGEDLSASSVQSLSHVQLFATPESAACQASLSITNSWSLLKLMSIELVMPSNPLILCHPLLLPSVFPSTRVYLLSRVQNQDWLVETGPEKRKCRLQCHVTTWGSHGVSGFHWAGPLGNQQWSL